MAAPKGNKFSNGRPPGSPNKVTKELRDRFKDFADGNFDKVQGWLDSVAKEDPAEAAKLYLAFSERIIGKVTSQNIDIQSGGKPLKQPILNILPPDFESEAE